MFDVWRKMSETESEQVLQLGCAMFYALKDNPSLAPHFSMIMQNDGEDGYWPELADEIYEWIMSLKAGDLGILE